MFVNWKEGSNSKANSMRKHEVGTESVKLWQYFTSD
jgi:hypothetical protein